MSLAYEAGVVGLVLAVIMAAVVYVSGPIDTVQRGLVLGFVMGVVIHLGFELTGANAAYCTLGAACRRP